MARAKRTDRAEARRKYRAYLQAQEDAGVIADGDEAGAAGHKPIGSRAPRPQGSSQPGDRLSLFAAAKAAYRQPHYIDDIRNVRSLVFGSKAIWPAAALCLVAGAYIAIRINSSSTSDPILPLLYQFVFFPVPLLPPMMAGFFAPRSTWLAGMIASFIATMTLVVIIWMFAGKFAATAGGLATTTAAPTTSSVPSAAVSAVPSATLLVTSSPAASLAPAASPTPESSGTSAPIASPSATSGTSGSTSTSLTVNNLSDLLNLAGILLAQSLAFGALMAAGSGWYKRFLSLSSGPKKPPSSRSGRARPAQRRRPVPPRPASRS